MSTASVCFFFWGGVGLFVCLFVFGMCVCCLSVCLFFEWVFVFFLFVCLFVFATKPTNPVTVNYESSFLKST